MLLPIHKIKCVEFKEHPEKTLFDKTIRSFDIITDDLKDNSFNQKGYCIKLIFKIFSLRKRNRHYFFTYQCNHVKYPWGWLNSVFSLLNNNWRMFCKLGQQKKLIELIDLVESVRNKYPRNEENTFSRNEEKDDEGYLDIDRLPYIIWNGPINILVDIYYQMLTIKTEKGEPLISNTKSEVVNHLIYCYRKADGSLLKRSNILAILEPSAVDKRPSIEHRIDLQKIIDKYKTDN